MRRIAAISVSVMLSAVIIALGAGISFVRCCHRQTMELAQLAGVAHHEYGNASVGGNLRADGGDGGGKCCGHHADSHGDGPVVCMPDCMETVTVRLAPVVPQTYEPVALTPVLFPMSSPADMAGLQALPEVALPRAWQASAAPHSPPRQYLRLIRVLLI